MVRRTHSAERTQRAIADVYKFGARPSWDVTKIAIAEYFFAGFTRVTGSIVKKADTLAIYCDIDLVLKRCDGDKLLFLFYLDDAYDLDTHQMQDDCRQLQAKVVKPMRVIVWTLDVAGQKRKELESIDDAFCPAAQAGNLRKLGQASHLIISL
ncbi:MAG: hypothetical protein Q9175_006694 [Cornicularia normoerica]